MNVLTEEKTLRKTFHPTRAFVLRKKSNHPAYFNHLYYFSSVKFNPDHYSSRPYYSGLTKHSFFTKVISPREKCFLLHFFWILSPINETFLIFTWSKNKIINMNCIYYETWIALFQSICNSTFNGFSFPNSHFFFFSCVNSERENYHTLL